MLQTCYFYLGDILVRYIESGCYKGFMNHSAAKILREELHIDRLNLLNLYTPADIVSRQTNG